MRGTFRDDVIIGSVERFEARNVSREQIVTCGDDLEISLVMRLAQHRTPEEQRIGHPLRILLNNVADECGSGVAGALKDGWPQLGHDGVEVGTGCRGTRAGRLHGSAAIVPKDNDKASAEMLDGVLDRAEGYCVDNISGGADHKKITE